MTVAIDARDGTILWRFTPPSYSSLAGSAQITTATPVADPGRKWIYAASPDGKIQKLSIANGHVAWRARSRSCRRARRSPSSLNYANGHVIATTGGYIGDAPPYQGHVVAHRRRRTAGSCTSGTRSAATAMRSSTRRRCPASDSAIWGRAGAVVDPGSGNLLVATGNAPWNGHTNWGDAVLVLSPNGEAASATTRRRTRQS